eukprot:TRINITY_DN28866_c0_g1_i1.p1 TRINITY_DN28866_c0_g1~~TRINITY_DN28866_c0_g1_i1.p1  ORF type:complete len:111 (-),score=11.90 TRINITY_DN28866_c0_g1_i1:18-350(-)
MKHRIIIKGELEEHANALQDIEQKNTKLMELKEQLLDKENEIAKNKIKNLKITQQCKQKGIEIQKQQKEINEKNELLLEEQNSLTQQIRLITEENERLKMESTMNHNLFF